ncbi:MAG: T9SS type A sorting domain-containing protein [Lishizhenia sp.]
MNKFKLIALICSSSYFGFSQSNSEIKSNALETTNKLGQKVVTITPSTFSKTIPFKNLPEVFDGVDPNSEPKEVRNNFQRDGYLEAQTQIQPDGALQGKSVGKQLSPPIVNFNGLNGSGFPPDPSGAAGPNHYVQAVNTVYRVYDKNGSPETFSFSLSTLWPNSSNLGDPIVMYDRHADRWFISQFSNSPNGIMIAISQTPDPTGEYYAYSYTLSQFPDYPKYSIWWDGYYMTSNSSHTAVVFEREKMLAGDPSAQMISLSLPSLNTGGFRSPLPADADGDLPPNGTPCYFFNLEDNAFNGVSQDQIEIYEMTTDWDTPNNTQVVSSQQLQVASFDAVFTGGFANIAQPGTSQRLDAIQGVLMYRAQHTRWVNHNSIMLSHAVDLGGNRSAIRWYELRDNNDGVWTVHQQSTFAPDNSSRWMSSVAMDKHGHIGMAYSVCNANNNVFPGIRYTGRLRWNDLNIMGFQEASAIEGGGSQTFTDRYGDYGHLSLDPDGETFWYTGEYLGSNGSKRTRIFSFNLNDVVGLEEDAYYANLELNAFTNGGNLNVNVSGVKDDEEILIQLIAMNGQVVNEKVNVKPVSGICSEVLNVNSVKSGVYFVRIGNGNFQETKKIIISE